jgi:hypothetical protein
MEHSVPLQQVRVRPRSELLTPSASGFEWRHYQGHYSTATRSHRVQESTYSLSGQVYSRHSGHHLEEHGRPFAPSVSSRVLLISTNINNTDRDSMIIVTPQILLHILHPDACIRIRLRNPTPTRTALPHDVLGPLAASFPVVQ